MLKDNGARAGDKRSAAMNLCKHITPYQICTDTGIDRWLVRSAGKAKAHDADIIKCAITHEVQWAAWLHSFRKVENEIVRRFSRAHNGNVEPESDWHVSFLVAKEHSWLELQFPLLTIVNFTWRRTSDWGPENSTEPLHSISNGWSIYDLKNFVINFVSSDDAVRSPWHHHKPTHKLMLTNPLL